MLKASEIILNEKLVSIIRLEDAAKMEQIVTSLYHGGIRVVEITMNTPGALEAIHQTSELFPDMLVGAGTVLDEKMAKETIQAGAKFILSPILNKETVEVGVQEDVPVIPGVLSPTEAYNAYQYGADIVKVFPIRSFGTAYAKDILGPLPFIKLMGVGGIAVSNTEKYLKAGWHSLGIGTQLVNDELVKNERFHEIENRAKQFIEMRERAIGN